MTTIYFTTYFTNSITNTFRNCITCFHNLLSRKIPKRDKESRRVTKGACRVKVGRRRGPKGAKSVLGKGMSIATHSPGRLLDTVAQFARPQRPKDDSCSVQGHKDDSCIVHKAPKTTVAQFTRRQRRQLHSLQGPKDDCCTV